MLKEYFKKNTSLYQYIYSTLFPKYFGRVDDYCVKKKLVFEVAHAGYKNQKESLRFVQLKPPTEVKEEENETVDEAPAVAVVEAAPSKSTTVQKSKKRKINANNAAEKILLKKWDEKNF